MPETNVTPCKLKTLAAFVAGIALFPIAAADIRAQGGYPERPVRFIVATGAGGGIDVVARIVADKLGTRFGKSFVVENREGAGGRIAADLVAKAAPDGYTLLFTPQGPLAALPFLVKDMPYDARSAFAPVALVAQSSTVLVVHPDVPIRTTAQFIAYAKANPKKLTTGSQGLGSTPQLSAMMLERLADIVLWHVPYKSFQMMLTDLKTGRINMTFADTSNSLASIRSGELMPIAVAAQTRSPLLPDVPTFGEGGFPSVITGPMWLLFAPAGTRIEIRRHLADEIREILRLADVAARLKALGIEPRGSTPEALGDIFGHEYLRIGGVIRNAGITPQ